MGSTSGSQESAKQGEKRPYCRFAPPKTRDLDPSSYFPNSFRARVPGNPRASWALIPPTILPESCASADQRISWEQNTYGGRRFRVLLLIMTPQSEGDGSALGFLALSDGIEVPFRTVRQADAPALQRVHARCSERTIHLRFFGPLNELSDGKAH